jgi:hypothetical protein
MEDIKELLATTKKWLDIIYAPEESRRWEVFCKWTALEPEKYLRNAEQSTCIICSHILTAAFKINRAGSIDIHTNQ